MIKVDAHAKAWAETVSGKTAFGDASEMDAISGSRHYYINITIMMTEQQYWDEIRKVIHIFEKTKDLQKFYKEASDEDILEFTKTLPLMEGLGDLCYREHRYDEASNLHYGKALVAALTLLARFRDNDEFYQNVKRIRWKNALSDYHLAIEKWKEGQANIEETLAGILERGIWVCAKNQAEGVLLTGINPSYDGILDEPFQPISFNECFGRYWNPLKKILRSFIEQEKAAYLDLFPLRVTKQLHEFEKNVPISLKAAILEVSQREIERIRPRLIIHANSTSSFYWGTDTEHPWMGYQLTPIEMPAELTTKGKLYKIEGLQHSDKIICKKDTTRLIGTYLFICPYQSGGLSRLSKDRKLTEEDVLRLWNEYVEPNK